MGDQYRCREAPWRWKNNLEDLQRSHDSVHTLPERFGSLPRTSSCKPSTTAAPARPCSERDLLGVTVSHRWKQLEWKYDLVHCEGGGGESAGMNVRGFRTRFEWIAHVSQMRHATSLADPRERRLTPSHRSNSEIPRSPPISILAGPDSNCIHFLTPPVVRVRPRPRSTRTILAAPKHPPQRRAEGIHD